MEERGGWKDGKGRNERKWVKGCNEMKKYKNRKKGVKG